MLSVVAMTHSTNGASSSLCPEQRKPPAGVAAGRRQVAGRARSIWAPIGRRRSERSKPTSPARPPPSEKYWLGILTADIARQAQNYGAIKAVPAVATSNVRSDMDLDLASAVCAEDGLS